MEGKNINEESEKMMSLQWRLRPKQSHKNCKQGWYPLSNP